MVMLWKGLARVVATGMMLAGTPAIAAGVAGRAEPDAQPSQTRYDRHAQIRLELGGSERDVVRLLEREGYSEIRITKSSFTKVRAQACFRGDRYSLKIKRIGGRISRGDKIGSCVRQLSPKEIVAKLNRRGLSRVSVSDLGGRNFVVTACDNNRRVRLQVSKSGDIVSRTNLGRCRREVDIAEIRQRLREDGYNRIKLVDRGERRFIVEACTYDERVRLVLSRSGRIRRQEITGTCTLPIKPADIAGRIRKLGYDRIKVVDGKLPVYRAEACRKLTLMQIRMNRYGEVISQTRSGECDPPLNRAQVVQLLRERGANRIEVQPLDRGGFLATTCLKLKKLRFRLNRYGDILKRRSIGECVPPPRLPRLLQNFRARGVSNMRIYVEGCRKNRRIRFAVNAFGEITDRERIGRCR